MSRVSSTAMDSLIGQQIPVLDHGFIRVVDYMGDDSSIVQAARVSYGKGTKTPSEDSALIDYLMRMYHTSCFEMCSLKIHAKLPIFVARQWIRHRTASLNEYSARYSVMEEEYYIPSVDDIKEQSSTNKQGRGDPLSEQDSVFVLDQLSTTSTEAYRTYADLLEKGLSRELARAVLPVNFYTQMYWKIDLHNLMHFIKLRADPHAQYEIRVYADVLLEIVRKWVPLTYGAFMKYRMDSFNMSGPALEVVQRLICGDSVTLEDSGLGRREYNELMLKLIK